MAYFTIRQSAVFLSDERYRAVHQEVGRDKDASWRIGSMISGNPAVAEKVALMQKWLEAKHDANPASFREEWVKFDLRGKEASENAWDLLYDWCSLRGYSYLSDTRSEVEQLVSGWSANSFQYPMGRSFSLNHRVFEQRSWWRVFSRPSYRTVAVHIDIDEVTQLIGTLDRFVVLGSRIALICDHDLQIRFWGNQEQVLPSE